MVEIERQCSGCKCLEVVEIYTSVKDDATEDKVLSVFWEIGAEIGYGDIKAYQMVKTNQTIKFNNRESYIQVIQFKKQLKNNVLFKFSSWYTNICKPKNLFLLQGSLNKYKALKNKKQTLTILHY